MVIVPVQINLAVISLIGTLVVSIGQIARNPLYVLSAGIQIHN